MELIEFGSIMHIEKGKKPVIQKKEKENGFLPYVDIKAFETGVVDNYTNGERCLRCNEGEILIVCDGSRSGFVGRAIDGYVGSTLAKISADGLASSYLYYFLQSKYMLLNTRNKGTGTPHLDPMILRKQKIYVPSFLEQGRIVARIEELFSDLDRSVETIKTIKKQLRLYRQAVLKESFRCVYSYAPSFPIKEVCNEIKVGIVIKPTQYYTPDEKNGVKAFRSANVNEFSVNDNDWVFLTREGHLANQRSVVHTGDLLIVRSGYPGTACVVPEKYNEYNAIDILIAVPNTQVILPDYLCAFTNSPFGRKLVAEKKRGVAQAHLNVGGYSRIKIPVPDLSVQKEIVKGAHEKLSECERINRFIDEIIRDTDSIRQSILRKAFEGELK